MNDTNHYAERLKELITDSQSILVTSHISPDPDAMASVLLMGTTLIKNYPDKKVVMALEEEPIGLEFLKGYKEVVFNNLLKTLNEQRPDLFILLDGNNYERASRLEGKSVREYIEANEVKTIIIDHHEPAGKEETYDLYINQNTPATAQEIYQIFKQLDFKQPTGFAQTAMLGLYADSGGFAYLNDKHSETFQMADDLVTNGASIEKIKNSLDQYSESDMKVLSELAGNVSVEGDYTYSFIGDEFVYRWLANGKNAQKLNKGTEGFVNNFIRNINGRLWGFIVYKNVMQGGNVYSVSLRALKGAADVSLIAGKLGGGGHKGAAGAKFEASSIREAVDKVKSVIAAG